MRGFVIMNSLKDTGKDFCLETQKSNDIFFNKNIIALNIARNALRYVIKAYAIKEIWLPYYTCPVVWQSVRKENCKMNFYHTDKSFMPATDFPPDAFILYTNYFGICAKNVKTLAEKYKNLIVDNAQAFYMPKYGIASFNSVRKFFAVPDGSILECDKELEEKIDTAKSYNCCSYLLKDTDTALNYGGEEFYKNELFLNGEPVKYMSNLTRSLISGMNLDSAKQKRLDNFRVLHNALANSNELKFELDLDDVPMVYPYLIKTDGLREYLIKNGIYVETYWNKLSDRYSEGYFQKYLLPLPLEQKYTTADMRRIIETVEHY